MHLTNSRTRYGAVTKCFHWLTALLIFTNIPLGFVASELAEAIRASDSVAADADIARATLLFSLHKTLGVTIFFVALARILWAIAQPRPGLLNADRRIEATLAETVHWLLYGSLLLVPLSGWIHHAATTGFAPIWWPFGQSLPFVPKSQALAAAAAGLHVVVVSVLILALLLHVAGALKHHVIDHDFTLRRMWPGGSEAPEPHAQQHRALPLLVALALWAAAIVIGGVSGAFDGEAAVAPETELDAVQSGWQVESGTLGLTVTQLGSPVQGSFTDWTAAISFADPATPGPAGAVEVTVAIGSLRLGSVTAQALGPDFFDVQRFPTATFHGTIEKTGTGYVASGPLTIRDKTVQITLPFTLDLAGNSASMAGSLTLQRLDFDIGGSVGDAASLGLAVDISVALTAVRAAGA